MANSLKENYKNSHLLKKKLQMASKDKQKTLTIIGRTLYQNIVFHLLAEV
jgi:hypothetical protein